MTGVFVYADSGVLLGELIGGARALGIGDVNIAVFNDADPASCGAKGADRIFSFSGEQYGTFRPDVYSVALKDAIKESGASLVLIGSTRAGREIAPRIAALLNAGMVSDAIKIDAVEGGFILDKVGYGGNAMLTQKVTTQPVMATVAGKVFTAATEAGRGEVVTPAVDAAESLSKVLDVVKSAVEGVKIEDAKVIVAVGRGVKKQEDLDLARDLANTLGGEIGCTRPLSADLKWLPTDHWIGLSGHKVKPNIYIAVGISGQIQHLAGMRDSDLVIAINKDPDAPIFKNADYGIIGDLYEVLPELTQKFKTQ